MKKIYIAAGLALLVMVLGCGGMQTQPGQGSQVPAGCEKSLLWSKGFMPYGPLTVRTAVATANAVEPQIRPTILLGCLTAYRALKDGGLPQVLTAFKDEKVIRYFTPVVVLLDELGKQGAVPQATVKLDDCDRQILLNLVRDIALDAGGSPGDFQ